MNIIKKGLFILSILLLSGCSFEKEVTTVIEVEDNLSFNYGEDVNLYSIFHIIDGSIIDDDYSINTLEMGKHEINVNYKNSNKKKQVYQLSYEVIDDVKPILGAPDDIYFIVGSEDKIMNKIFLGDNADRSVSYEIIGNYDMNTIGTYELEIKAIDDSNNEVNKKTKLHIIEGNNDSIKNYSDGTPLDYYIKNYKDENNMIGIDISAHQGDINFQQVKDSGIEFVMLRIGYGPNKNGEMTLDDLFDEYYNQAKEVGLKVGAYLYSYATTMDEADIQSNWVIEMLKDKQLDLPVAYDWESWNTFYSCNMNFFDLNNITNKFLNNLIDKGYDVMLYGSKYYLEEIWKLDKYKVWLAQYASEASYNNNYTMWQLSNSASVNGINSLTDINILYNKKIIS